MPHTANDVLVAGRVTAAEAQRAGHDPSHWSAATDATIAQLGRSSAGREHLAAVIAGHAVRLTLADEADSRADVLTLHYRALTATDHLTRMQAAYAIRLLTNAFSRSVDDHTVSLKLIADYLDPNTVTGSTDAAGALNRRVLDVESDYSAHLVDAWYSACGEALLFRLRSAYEAEITSHQNAGPDGARETSRDRRGGAPPKAAATIQAARRYATLRIWNTRLWAKVDLAEAAGITRPTLNSWLVT